MPLSHFDNVEYSLFSESRDRVIIPEPINFESGNGNLYERDKESKGFLRTKTNDLEFFKEAYTFLRAQFATKGIAEEVIMQRRVKSDDRIDERWRVVSETYLDMSKITFDDDRQTAKTEAIEGGMKRLIDSKLSDEFDLTSKTSVTGEDIGAISNVYLQLDQKEILLRSELSVEPGTSIKAVVTGGDSLNARSVPFQVDINSDANDVTSVLGDKLSAAGGNYAALSFDKTSNLFYTVADQATTLILNGRIEIQMVGPEDGIGTVSMDLVRYVDGEDFKFGEKINLRTGTSLIGNKFIYEFDDYVLDVNLGDSFAVGLLSNTTNGIRYQVIEAKLTITENSTFPSTPTRAMTPFQLGERLVSMITGKKDSFRSDLLTGNYKLITQGFWVRQFPDIISEGTDQERRIQFITSMEDFLEHLSVVEGDVAWWIEKEGNNEVMRLESLEYTQQSFVGIEYKKDGQYVQASNITRKSLDRNFYGKIVLGSNKGGEGYEEVAGLQAVCGRAEWSTINPGTSEYRRITPYALSDVDIELPRRKPYSEYPETDTKYDSVKSVLDCKLLNGIFVLKKWQDIYEEVPQNIYRPDSSYNLDLTPARLLLKHSAVINAGLYHYPSEFIYFASSNCNSSLITKKTGEDYLEEGSPIPHSRLDRPRIRPMAVEFDLEVELQLEEQITGITNDVQNWFGLVAVSTGTEIEYLRLNRVDTNNEGKHQLVEAFT